jgi:hypothetical protein
MQRLEEQIRALTELVVGQNPPHPRISPSPRSTPAPPRSNTSEELVFEEGLYPIVARDPRFTIVLDYRTYRLEDKSLYFTAYLLKATQLLHNTLPKFDGMEGALIMCYGAEHPRGGFLRTRDSRLTLAICAGFFLVHSAIFTFNRTLLPT